MKLYMNTMSPYARVVDVVCREAGLSDKVEYLTVNPWVDYQFRSISVSGKVPALELADGRMLLESDCIARYFICLGDKRSLLPEESADVADRLELLGLAKAVMDTAIGIVMQKRFAAEAGDSFLAQRWSLSISTLIEALNNRIAETRPSDQFDLADICVVAALDYVDFRLPEPSWSEANPALKQWVDSQTRDSLVATRPVDI